MTSEEGATLTDQVLAALGLTRESVRQLAEGVQALAALAAPELVRLHEASLRIAQLPETLCKALGGLLFYHPSLAFADLGKIDAAFRAGGSGAALKVAYELLDGLLGESSFRDVMAARWVGAGRGRLMADVLKAHDAGLYFAAVPAALSQVEGVVAEHLGVPRLKFSKLAREIAGLHGKDDLLAPSVLLFRDAVLTDFAHGKPTPPLSRHAILHGADKDYGTRHNSVAAIMWADYVLLLILEARAAAGSSR